MVQEGSWLSTSSMKSQWRSVPGKKIDILVPTLVRPLSDDIVNPSKFRLLWSRRWRRSSEHINVKEARVLLSSLVRTSRVASLFGGRKCSASDNLPAILAFDKGRSPSKPMNKLCRKSAAVLGATGIRWFLRHVETKRNTADEPSRRFEPKRMMRPSLEPIYSPCSPSSPSYVFREQDFNNGRTSAKSIPRVLLLADVVPPPGLGREVCPRLVDCSGSFRAEDQPRCGSDNAGHSKPRHRSKLGGAKPVFWEVFAGCGNLSKYMKKAGFQVLPPLDIKINPLHDLTRTAIQKVVSDTIVMFDVDYIHFGTPCSVFSRARHNISNVLRGRQKEVTGCNLAAWTAEACILAMRKGIRWTIENPKSSRLWEFPLIECLFAHPDVAFVDFDMCRFNTAYKKPTRILGTLSGLRLLEKHCCHVKHSQVLRGRVKADLGNGLAWVNRTQLAGAYPDDLCSEWARIAFGVFQQHDSFKHIPSEDSLGEQFAKAWSEEKRKRNSKAESIFSCPQIIDAISFGQRSRAEAARKQQKRSHLRKIQNEKNKVNFQLQRCPCKPTA